MFQHGPAENDPEYGPSASTSASTVGLATSASTSTGTAVDLEGDIVMDVDDAEKAKAFEGDDGADDAMGTWVRVDGGERVGGSSGMLDFTVVGCVFYFRLHSHAPLTDVHPVVSFPLDSYDRRIDTA